MPTARPHAAAALLVSLPLVALLAGCGGDPASPAPAAPVPVAVEGRPQRGPADAWVTMVEFADFQCPYCAAVEPTLAALAAEYRDDLRLVFRHLPLPFHSRARPAAIAAECAYAQGEAPFWAFHDLIFASNALDDTALAAQAAQAGVDTPSWESCLASAAAGAAVDADFAAGVAAGVNGTPTFFVNGRPVVGNEPIATFRAAIDRALADARASGIPRAEYYSRAVLGR